MRFSFLFFPSSFFPFLSTLIPLFLSFFLLSFLFFPSLVTFIHSLWSSSFFLSFSSPFSFIFCNHRSFFLFSSFYSRFIVFLSFLLRVSSFLCLSLSFRRHLSLSIFSFSFSILVSLSDILYIRILSTSHSSASVPPPPLSLSLLLSIYLCYFINRLHFFRFLPHFYVIIKLSQVTSILYSFDLSTEISKEN